VTNSTRDALSAGRSLSSRNNPPSINRDDIAARIKSLQANQGVTSRSDIKSNPPSLSSRTLPPSLRNVPTETNNRTPRDIGKHADTTPYRSLFKPNTDPPHGNFARHDSRSGGGRHNAPIRVGPDHRGAPHGTPRHDAGMHGHTTYHHKPYYPYYGSHQRHPGHFYFGRYGYGYRGSGLSIYLGHLGSPWYGSTTSYYYEPYYVPYYVPYTVPYVVQTEPYVVQTEPYLVETEVVEPAAAVAPTLQNGAVIAAAGEAAYYQLEAEQAFQGRSYEEAARLSNHAIVEDSQNGKLHLFASQTFFALGDYTSAAAAVQQAAALLDRSEWGFVVENYQRFYRGDDYVTQMSKLDEYITQNPDAAYAYFLRGYHFLFLGHKDAARNDLAKVVELENRDLLAAELLKMAGGQVPEPAPVLPPAAEIVPPPPAEGMPGGEQP
jgi:hypothetical protein